MKKKIHTIYGNVECTQRGNDVKYEGETYQVWNGGWILDMKVEDITSDVLERAIGNDLYQPDLDYALNPNNW